ncbi:hypothetical protein [Jannaschia helgolandensis]|uniref:hypothetical protein n=1 Tax=Jannaschia helgolandensis TaxID=188906 RepID=UPI0030DD3B83|tara:strand:+ start:4005 stop:4448 length:444 start_codon:yes stop_codon:yes gene_type:complete
MKVLILALIGASTIATAVAAEKVSGNNYMLADVKAWPTGETTGYWMSSTKGVRVSDDPDALPEPTECDGAGYWDANGDWGEGICRYGDATDFVLSSYKVEKGAKTGVWEILQAGGKYEGLTGSGTFESTRGQRGASVSAWEGEVSMP